MFGMLFDGMKDRMKISSLTEGQNGGFKNEVLSAKYLSYLRAGCFGLSDGYYRAESRLTPGLAILMLLTDNPQGVLQCWTTLHRYFDVAKSLKSLNIHI